MTRPESTPDEEVEADPCDGCEGSCRICSNRYRSTPGEVYGERPSNEQMEHFKRGGRN